MAYEVCSTCGGYLSKEAPSRAPCSCVTRTRTGLVIIRGWSCAAALPAAARWLREHPDFQPHDLVVEPEYASSTWLVKVYGEGDAG